MLASLPTFVQWVILLTVFVIGSTVTFGSIVWTHDWSLRGGVVRFFAVMYLFMLGVVATTAACVWVVNASQG